MFTCCCVNKKALKKAAADSEGLNENCLKKEKPCDNNNSTKPPINTAAEENSCKSPIRNDKSNSSDEDNNLSRLSGLILSDGLVGKDQGRRTIFREQKLQVLIEK